MVDAGTFPVALRAIMLPLESDLAGLQFHSIRQYLGRLADVT